MPAYLDAEYNTVSVQDLPTVTESEHPPVETVSEPDIRPQTVAQPVIKPLEVTVSPQPVVEPLKEEEDEEGYVNLSLF